MFKTVTQKPYKRGLALLIVVFFLLSVLIGAFQLRQLINELKASSFSTIRLVTQLQFEQQAYLAALRLYRSDPKTRIALVQHYRDYQAQLASLLRRQEREHKLQHDDLNLLIHEMFQHLQRQNMVFSSSMKPLPAVDKLIRQQERYQKHIGSLLIQVYEQKNTQVSLSEARLLKRQLVLSACLLALLASGVLLIVFIVRENRQTRYLAYHDSVTGLTNRSGLEQVYLRDCQDQRQFAVMMLDLNGFKSINDRFGHDYGDWVLQIVGQRLAQTMRHQDEVSRIGGDEFAVILRQVKGREECINLAQRIIERIEERIYIAEQQCTVGVSIGIVLAAETKGDWDALLNHADEAMYQVKAQRQGSAWRFYESTQA